MAVVGSVCDACGDTHLVDKGGMTVMCTSCPVPCDLCRKGGTGPFCGTTPCPCACHPQASVSTSVVQDLQSRMDNIVASSRAQHRDRTLRSRADDPTGRTRRALPLERAIVDLFMELEK
jgi:hypothetical protein